MANNPFPGPGLSFTEALERPADIDAWYAADRLQKLLAAAGGPISPEQFPQRRDAPNEAAYARQWRAAEQRRSLMADLNDAREQLRQKLERAIRAGQVFAVARLTPDGPRCVLTYAECRTLGIFALPPSPDDAQAEPPHVADLGFYGLLDLPDVATRVSGMRLADAFRDAVLNWPELHRVVASSPLVGPVLDGLFTFSKHAWPVAIEDCCLADAWLVSQRYKREFRGRPYTKNESHVLDREAHDTLIAIGRYVSARVARFLKLLRTGTLVARDGPAIVPTWWWQRPSYRIDFQKGRLCEQVGEDLIERSGELIVTARAAQLAPSTHASLAPDASTLDDTNRPSEFHVKPIEPDAARSLATEGAANKPARVRSEKWHAIDAAVSALWPAGIQVTNTVQYRIYRIVEWQRANGVEVASERSIYRYFEEL